MSSRRALQAWPRKVVPEAGLVIARWTAAKTGTIASLWPATPRWLGRYLEGLSSAHAHSTAGKS